VRPRSHPQQEGRSGGHSPSRQRDPGQIRLAGGPSEIGRGRSRSSAFNDRFEVVGSWRLRTCSSRRSWLSAGACRRSTGLSWSATCVDLGDEAFVRRFRIGRNVLGAAVQVWSPWGSGCRAGRLLRRSAAVWVGRGRSGSVRGTTSCGMRSAANWNGCVRPADGRYRASSGSAGKMWSCHSSREVSSG